MCYMCTFLEEKQNPELILHCAGMSFQAVDVAQLLINFNQGNLCFYLYFAYKYQQFNYTSTVNL